MKKLFLYSFLLLFITIVNSCIKINEDQKTYYKFEETDYDKLLNFEEDQIIIFQNNLGATVKYKERYLSGVQKLSTIGWIESLDGLEPPIPFPDDNSINYDTQISRFFEIDNSVISLNYRYFRFPEDIYQAQKNNTTEYPSNFIGQIYFNKWNALENTRIINIDFNDTTTSMTFNGVTYDNVYTIESRNPNIKTCGFIYNVNKVFYDLHTGIIGYDEVDGTQWRLIN